MKHVFSFPSLICFTLFSISSLPCSASGLVSQKTTETHASAESGSSASQTGVFLDTVTIGALDKVTARTSTITLRIGEPKKIGTLIVKALRAWKSNPEEKDEAKVFFDVVEQKPAKSVSKEHSRGTIQTKTETTSLVPVFQGWMFQSNRSISSIDHPVYDFWVLDVTGNPHNGIMIKSETFSDEADINSELHELIDQLMDEDVSNPIAIEPTTQQNPRASESENIPDLDDVASDNIVNKDMMDPKKPNKNLVKPDPNSHSDDDNRDPEPPTDTSLYDVDEEIVGQPLDELRDDQDDNELTSIY